MSVGYIERSPPPAVFGSDQNAPEKKADRGVDYPRRSHGHPRAARRFGGTVGGTTLGCENRSRALGRTYVVNATPAAALVLEELQAVAHISSLLGLSKAQVKATMEEMIAAQGG